MRNMGLREYMTQYRTRAEMGAKDLMLVGLTYIAGGCNEELKRASGDLASIGTQQFVVSAVRDVMEVSRGQKRYENGNNYNQGNNNGYVQDTEAGMRAVESLRAEREAKKLQGQYI